MNPLASRSWSGPKTCGHAWWRGRYHLPLAEAVRGGVVCAVPAVLAALLHDPLLCWSAIAAFWTVLSDPAGAGLLRRRFVAGLALGIFGALGALCAVASSSVPLLTVALTGAVVFVGGLLRSRGADVGLRALLAATAFSVAAAFPVHGFHAATHYALYILAGNLWALACGVAMWRTSQTGPVRRAAFIYFEGMAGFVHRMAGEAAEVRSQLTSGARATGRGRARLRAKLEALHTSIDEAGESWPSAYDWRAIGDRGMAIVVGIQSLFDRDMGQSGRGAARLLSPVLAQFGNLVEEWALAIRTDASGGARTFGTQKLDLNREIRLCRRSLWGMIPDAASHEFVTTCLALVSRFERLIAGPRMVGTSLRASPQAAGAAPATAAWRQLVRDLRREVKPGSVFARYAARLSVGAMIAVAITTHFTLRQGYWIVLTSMFVVQPNFAQTLKVSTLRVAGTILGATLASVLGVIFHSPLLLALAILPLAAGSLAARSVSYVSYILFLTPHFILVAQLGLPSGSPWELAIWRIVNSAAGALLGIAVAFILWPHWERDRLASSVSKAVDRAAAYLSCALRQFADDDRQAGSVLVGLRRDACLAIDEVEAALARMKLEPIPQGRRMACGTIALKALRKITGAASLLESTKGGAPPAHDAARLNGFAEWAMASLGDELRRLKCQSRLAPFERRQWSRADGACRSYPVSYVEQEVASAIATTSQSGTWCGLGPYVAEQYRCPRSMNLERRERVPTSTP